MRLLTRRILTRPLAVAVQQQIAAAPPSEQERIAAEATNALAKAVTDQGLSVEEYDSILEVAQNDPQVGEKIRQRLPPSVK